MSIGNNLIKDRCSYLLIRVCAY